MCGIVGIAGKIEYADEDTMKRLLLLDYFRGKDSTGFASISNTNVPAIAKLASGPIDLFGMKKFDTALNGVSSKVFMGHNRHATRGAVNNVNAHPYEFGHIVGCHNGTLETLDKFELEDMLGEKYDTDSMALFAAIEKFGVETVIPMLTDGRDTHSGAWSLVWWNGEDKTLNFIRNKHRPMWFGYNKDFKKLFYASEWEFISSAAALGGFEMEAPFSDDKNTYKYWPTDVDTHYKFNVDELMLGGKMPKPIAKVLKAKEPAPVPVQGNFPLKASNTHGSSSKPSQTSGQTTTYLGSAQKKPALPKIIIPLMGDVGNPLAGFYTPLKFRVLSKEGCSWCSKPIEYGTPGLTIFDEVGTVLCPKCSGHEEERFDNDPPPTTRIFVNKETITQYS